MNERMKELTNEGINELMNKWVYNEHGKPSFTPSLLHSFTPYFSISHCKTGIAVAVADEPVGIDIESIRRADEELMERVLSNGERLAVSGERDRDRAFTKLWTQKEAVVKMLGTGIESFEQLQNILSGSRDHETTRSRKIETIEKANYIYSIAYGKLCSISA